MSAPFRRRLRTIFGTGRLLRQVATVLSGTATAQIVTVVAMIPLARLYTPEDFGLFALIQAAVGIGVTLAALRYDVAIVLPRSEVVARVLGRIASRSILISSLILSLGFVVAHPFISRSYASSTFATSFVFVGLAVFLTAHVTCAHFWLTRMQGYGRIAANRLTQALTTAVFQITFAWLLPSFLGLFCGLLAGQLIALITVRRSIPEIRQGLPPDAPSMRSVAIRYRKMPLANGPNALLDAIKNMGINVLIGNIAVGGLGQYSLAFRITKAPVSLLVGAVSQVLLQRLSTTQAGGMTKLLMAAFARIALFAIPSFTVVYFLSPPAFAFVFGQAWTEAGYIAQALVPWLFMLTFTTPLSSLFIVIERQGVALAFAAVLTCASVGFLAFSPFNLVTSIRWLAWIMAAVLLLWVVAALLVSRSFDSKVEPPEAKPA